jgi:hypothetical protein
LNLERISVQDVGGGNNPNKKNAACINPDHAFATG